MAAVSDDLGTGDVGRFRACEEGNYSGDLEPLAIATDGDTRADNLGNGASVRIHVGIDWARMNYVDGDAFRTQITHKIPL